MVERGKRIVYDEIINYIGNDYNRCLYLYLDLEKYGLENKNVKVWVQRDVCSNISAVILQYYTGMHIFSKDYNYNTKELCYLINESNPSIICAEKKIIQDIFYEIKNDEYEIEFGWIRKLKKLHNYGRDGVILATKEDFKKIAKLLYQDDDIGSSYNLDNLQKQMYERNKEGFVRNYVIKDGNEVICHAGTGAENKKVALLNYVITAPNYRKKGLAKKICSALCEDLIKSNKDVYLVNYSKESTDLYDKIGFEISCEWGKLFKNLKKSEEKKIC